MTSPKPTTVRNGPEYIKAASCDGLLTGLEKLVSQLPLFKIFVRPDA